MSKFKRGPFSSLMKEMQIVKVLGAAFSVVSVVRVAPKRTKNLATDTRKHGS